MTTGFPVLGGHADAACTAVGSSMANVLAARVTATDIPVSRARPRCTLVRLDTTRVEWRLPRKDRCGCMSCQVSGESLGNATRQAGRGWGWANYCRAGTCGAGLRSTAGQRDGAAGDDRSKPRTGSAPGASRAAARRRDVYTGSVKGGSGTSLHFVARSGVQGPPARATAKRRPHQPEGAGGFTPPQPTTSVKGLRPKRS